MYTDAAFPIGNLALLELEVHERTIAIVYELAVATRGRSRTHARCSLLVIPAALVLVIAGGGDPGGYPIRSIGARTRTAAGGCCMQQSRLVGPATPTSRGWRVAAAVASAPPPCVGHAHATMICVVGGSAAVDLDEAAAVPSGRRVLRAGIK